MRERSPPAMFHMSLVMSHMSHATCHMSHVMWGVLLRSVPRAIRGRYLLKVTFGADVFFLHPSILCGRKRAGPPKFLGEYEENSMFRFFCHTLTFKLFLIFNTCGRNFF